jgi:hydrogenase expression/formation protein HypC
MCPEQSDSRLRKFSESDRVSNRIGRRRADIVMNFGGVVKEVCLAFVPELAIGDYAIVHVGVAISKVDEESALETLKLLEETGMLVEELNATSSPTPDSACEIGASPVAADARHANPP